MSDSLCGISSSTRARRRSSSALAIGIGGNTAIFSVVHATLLEKAGLWISRRDGRQRWNHLDVCPIKEIHDRCISPYATHAVSLLARLKRDLEESRP